MADMVLGSDSNIAPYTRREMDQLLLILFDSFLGSMKEAPADHPIRKLLDAGYADLAAERMKVTTAKGVIEDTFRTTDDSDSVDECAADTIGDILGEISNEIAEDQQSSNTAIPLGSIVWCLTRSHLHGSQVPDPIEILVTGEWSPNDRRPCGIPTDRATFKNSISPLPETVFDSKATAIAYVKTVPLGHVFSRADLYSTVRIDP